MLRWVRIRLSSARPGRVALAQRFDPAGWGSNPSEDGGAGGVYRSTRPRRRDCLGIQPRWANPSCKGRHSSVTWAQTSWRSPVLGTWRKESLHGLGCESARTRAGAGRWGWATAKLFHRATVCETAAHQSMPQRAGWCWGMRGRGWNSIPPTLCKVRCRAACGLHTPAHSRRVTCDSVVRNGGRRDLVRMGEGRELREKGGYQR